MEIKKICKTPEGLAALSGLSAGVVTHLFGLVNVLHNYDDIAQQPRGYGTGVTSGRWLLSLMGDFCEAIGGNYNLPLVNGLLFLLVISLTASVMVSLLRINNKKLAVLVGALMTTFPSAFSTLAFRYTAVYYGVGILLSVVAAWVLLRYQYGLILSALCTACSLGIYQAYVPITIALFVLMLIRQTLEGELPFWTLVRRGVYCCASLILGLVFYYLLMQATLALYGTQLSNYQGVNEMGKLSLSQLPALVKEAYYTFLMMPLKDYCGVAAMRLLKIGYLLLAGSSAVLTGYILLKRVKKIESMLMTALLFLVFPLAVNFVVIMCPESWIYTLMVYSFVVVPCVPIVLLDCFLSSEEGRQEIRRWAEKGITAVLVVMICCYSYQTNVNYTALHYSNRQVENYLNSMVVQVRMTEGFRSDMQWAFIGEIEDPLLHSYWQYEMTYGGIEFTDWMLKRYSWPDWLRNYYGYSIPLLDAEKTAELSSREEVKAMPCWPDEGSVQIIDDTVVIKGRNG